MPVARPAPNCCSSWNRAVIVLRVEADLADAGEAITYVREATNPLASRGAAVRLRFNQLHDVRPSLSILRVDGARLDGRALMELFQVLEIAGEYRTMLVGVRERFPRLARRADALTDLRGFVRRFAKAFLPDGSLSDEASVALGRIRREMERQQKTIQQSLERFLRAHRSDGTVQEDFVTIRDDRFVVPIVAGQKGRVDGVIHGSSGSGRTLFVEPLETIQLNNQLVRLREDELREVERILSEITENLREHRDEIIASARDPGASRLPLCEGRVCNRLRGRDSEVQPRFRPAAGATRMLAIRCWNRCCASNAVPSFPFRLNWMRSSDAC